MRRPRSMAEFYQTVMGPLEDQPPNPELTYFAFVVHPPSPGPVVLAITHCDGTDIELDVLRDDIEIDDCVCLLKQYGIDNVAGSPGGGGSSARPHAVAGAILAASGELPS